MVGASAVNAGPPPAGLLKRVGVEAVGCEGVQFWCRGRIPAGVLWVGVTEVGRPPRQQLVAQIRKSPSPAVVVGCSSSRRDLPNLAPRTASTAGSPFGCGGSGRCHGV
jgi:hypothetical protein